MNRNISIFLAISGLTILFFLLDRLSKIFAESFASGEIYFGGFLRFILTQNEDLAFSVPFPSFAQIGLSLVLLGILFWYFSLQQRPESKWDILAVSLIFGGALGNLADRIFFGAVTDFIAVWRFPVFNLADTFLFLGVCYFLGKEYFFKRK